MFLQRYRALAEKVYLKGHQVQLTDDSSDPGSIDLTFRVEFGDLSHLTVELKTNVALEKSLLAKRLEDGGPAERHLKQELTALIQRLLGHQPKKLKVTVAPDILELATVHRYGYEVSVSFDLPALLHLTAEIERRVGQAFQHLAIDLEPGRGQTMDVYRGKVEGSADGRHLMQVLARQLGNKRYLADIEQLLDRVELTPVENQALRLLARDLDYQGHQADQARREPWRKF